MIPIFEILSYSDKLTTPPPIQVVVTDATINYEISKEGVVDEVEIHCIFSSSVELDKFIRLMIREHEYITCRYGWEGGSTNIEKFQIKGLSVSSDGIGRTLTIKAYSPMLEANEKKVPVLPQTEAVLSASEIITAIAAQEGWAIVDEKGESTIQSSLEIPEKHYVVKQMGDKFESTAQYMQRLANTVAFDYYMRYHKVTGQPIVYFKKRQNIQDIKYDFEYNFDMILDSVNYDEFKQILQYSSDFSVTKEVETLEASTNDLAKAELQEFNLEEMPDPSNSSLPAALNSTKEVSVTERNVESVREKLARLFVSGAQERVAELRIVTFGNPYAKQGMNVKITGCDKLTNSAAWNIISVSHNFSFGDSPQYQCDWKLRENAYPGEEEQFPVNANTKLQEFTLDSEDVK